MALVTAALVLGGVVVALWVTFARTGFESKVADRCIQEWKYSSAMCKCFAAELNRELTSEQKTLFLDPKSKPLAALNLIWPSLSAGAACFLATYKNVAPEKKVDAVSADKSESYKSTDQLLVPPAGKVVSKPVDIPAQKETSTAAPIKEPVAKASIAAVPAAGEERAQAVLRDESWVVPLGTFANVENVKQLQVKAEAAGVKSSTETIKTAAGEQIRVRGGPYKTKAEAEAARQALVAAGMDTGAVQSRVITEYVGGIRSESKGDIVGYEPSKRGGVFQIESVGYDVAEFLFFGGNKDIKGDTMQRIEVRKGNNPDIRIAVVRKMIAIIRETEPAEFSWDSVKLRKSITLSARPTDNAGLEDFMMWEFFDVPARGAVQSRAIADYVGRIRSKIKGNIVMPGDMPAGNPEAIFDVVQLPTGEVLSPVRLKKSSGYKPYDEALERAIVNASPLPKPDRPELFQRNLELKFRPLD
ncbi:MAG: TonB C-terminal domain-containing protein [Betaproteobacteria bacterium]